MGNRPHRVITWLLLLCTTLAGWTGCAPENRTGGAIATALASGPVRAWAAERSLALLDASLELDGALRAQDMTEARASWLAARIVYDEVQPVALAAAPELDLLIDGRFDNPLTQSGLRLIEQGLYSLPTPSSDELLRLGAALRQGAGQLPQALGDPKRTLDAGALLSTMSALVAVMATKADGSDSPYAGTAHLSIQHNLDGIRAIYERLAEPVRVADPALDERIRADIDALTEQVRGLQSTDLIADKLRFLRRCEALSQSLIDVTGALGLGATTAIDVT